MVKGLDLSFIRSGSSDRRGIMGYWSGKHFSKEHRIKLGEAKKGNTYAKGKHQKPKFFHSNRKFEDTDIELIMKKELRRRGIRYKKQVALCMFAPVDFYLPTYKIALQCDGDYWHNLPEQKIRDREHDKVLIENGFIVYRFWGSEIKQDVKGCVNRLFINQIRTGE
jgi:very-short-patch-repair endonuclease